MTRETMTWKESAASGAEGPVNGLDLQALGALVEKVRQDPENGRLQFRVTTRWMGGLRSESRPGPLLLGRQMIDRPFVMVADEPLQVLGSDTAPNPQEMLMAALNACLTVGWVAGAAQRGIQLQRLEIESQGTLDLRGFFALDPDVVPGYTSITYTVRVRGDGTLDEYREIHETVKKVSPNYFNLTRPVRLDGELVLV